MSAPLRHPVIPAAVQPQETETFRCKCGCEVSPDDIPCQPDYGVCSIVERRQTRFPRLTPAQKLLQRVEDAAVWRGVISGMNLKPGITGYSHTPDRPYGGDWGTARSQRHVL